MTLLDPLSDTLQFIVEDGDGKVIKTCEIPTRKELKESPRRSKPVRSYQVKDMVSKLL